MAEDIHEIQDRHAEENGKSDYGAKDIRVLEGLEAVRMRPGMYIGSTSARGLHHLVYEVVDNSIDEALAGYCTHIEVVLNDDGSCTVTDNGRGIPTGMHETGKPAMEVVLTVLHAGGKFGGDGYPISGGLHGVGISVVNALSEWMKVVVKREGEFHEIKLSRGIVTQPMKTYGKTDETGTSVTFKPDAEIFKEGVDFDYDTLKVRMRAGLPEQGPRHYSGRPQRRRCQKRTVPLCRRHRRIRPVPERRQGPRRSIRYCI